MEMIKEMSQSHETFEESRQIVVDSNSEEIITKLCQSEQLTGHNTSIKQASHLEQSDTEVSHTQQCVTETLTELTQSQQSGSESQMKILSDVEQSSTVDVIKEASLLTSEIARAECVNIAEEAMEIQSSSTMEELKMERMKEVTSESSQLMEKQNEVITSTVGEQDKKTEPRKPSSLLLEQNENSGFWTNSARNSVISLTETETLSLATEAIDNSTESPRGFLIQKRSSLSHTPDIVRVFEKDCVKQTNSFHEFQKVKSELRHVDDVNSPTEIRRFSQSAEFMKEIKK